jgi:hypothetical protein
MTGGLDLPIIMVTGNNDTDSIARAYDVGATDFIIKPVVWPTLPHRVDFMLRARDNLLALRASEQRNRALLQALPDTIFTITGDGVIAAHIAGGHEGGHDSLVGSRIERVVPDDVAVAARTFMINAPPCEQRVTYEFDVGEGADHRAFEARLISRADGKPRQKSSIWRTTTL